MNEQPVLFNFNFEREKIIIYNDRRKILSKLLLIKCIHC